MRRERPTLRALLVLALILALCLPGASEPTFNDRFGTAVSQRVVLYEEDKNNPHGKQYVGTLFWHTDTISTEQGFVPGFDLAVRAYIEIPERGLRVIWSFRRRPPYRSPFSDLAIDILFSVPTDFDGGGIASVKDVVLKQEEHNRGFALALRSAKISNGHFLMPFSMIANGRPSNKKLLDECGWLDIQMVYTNGKRAILSMEKGKSGERVFSDIFSDWSIRTPKNQRKRNWDRLGPHWI